MKVAENLNKANMSLVFIFLFLSIFAWVKSKHELIPVLIWTSSDFQISKNANYLAFDEIKSDLLQFYTSELLGDKKLPLIVIFLEEGLCSDDFDWKDENGNNAFPFLTELSVTSKVRYFREVEAPHQILTELSEKGYEWKNLKLDQNFVINEGDLFLTEFGKIDEHRPETLKRHDYSMKKISEQLANSGKSWICMYTAKHCNTKGSLPDKKLSSWYADEQFIERPVKALSLYHDEHTGFALLTKGSIELQLPSLNSTSFKPLDNYLKASATSFRRKINFAIWFLDYKLTFYLNQENHEWIIQEAKIVNDNGDTLILMRHREETANKSYTEKVEFLSEENPKIKVTLLKYKFLKLPQQQSCVKPYGVEMTALFILCLVVFIISTWNSVLESYDFSAESKVFSDKILTFKFDTMNFWKTL